MLSFAEGEGFKPPIPIRVYRISSPARSFTLPTFLEIGCKGNHFYWKQEAMHLK